MAERDDGLSLTLGLRLSLEGGEGRNAEKEKINFSSVPAADCMHDARKLPISDFFPSRPDGRGTGGSQIIWRGIDMNLFPDMAESEVDEVTRVSSPNSVVSSVCGKRDNFEVEAEKESSSRGSDDEDGATASDRSRKKLRLSKDQSLLLEETFKEHCTLNPKQKLVLAKKLNLRPRQVEVWFQNRRARTKLKQTEVDCDYLKRCCETLTQENRRLQKEVQELRALKFSSQFYMHMNPPTTLTMCPACEKMAVSSSSASTSTSAAPTPSKVTPKSSDCLPKATNRLSSWPALPVPFSPF